MAEANNNELNANMNNQIGIQYFPIPNYNDTSVIQFSIVEALRSVGYDSSMNYRLKIGQRNNISGAPFSPQYNLAMLNLMKEGKLIIP